MFSWYIFFEGREVFFFTCSECQKNIIVNFVIQKLKSKPTPIKKYTNWAKLINPAYTYKFQLKTTKEYYDESYEEPDDYKNEYFEDYKVTRKEIDETYGLDGSRCSPEGKLTHNPNDCASFLVCNHKKYMVSISKFLLK